MKSLMGRQINSLPSFLIKRVIIILLMVLLQVKSLLYFHPSRTVVGAPPPLLLLLLLCGAEKTVNPWLNYNLTFHPDFTLTGFCLTLQEQALSFCLPYFPFQLSSDCIFTYFHIWGLAFLYLFPLPVCPFVLISFYSFLHPVLFSSSPFAIFATTFFAHKE